MHLDCIANFLANWDDLVLAANTGQKETKYSKNYLMFDTVDKSVPIIVNESNMWIVRIMYNRRKKTFHLDLREWKQDKISLNFQPTANGIMLDIASWFKFLEPIYKLLNKHRGK